MSSKSPIDLTGKFALVTGGSRGIGRAISKLLAQNGAQVAFNYLRNREAAAEAKAEIAEVGLEPLEIRANVADEEHVDRMFDEIKEKLEAKGYPPLSPLTINTTRSDVRDTMALLKSVGKLDVDL